MKNLVLIGLSGCGKSSFGKRLARRLRMPLLDTDSLIVEAEGRCIPNIFSERGEAFFRDLETAACIAAASANGAVIATGGGAILREANMEALAQNGVIIFIDRAPSRILRSARLDDRPLVENDAEKLFRLYSERLPYYRRWAHAIVRSNGPRRDMKRCLLQIIRRYREKS